MSVAEAVNDRVELAEGQLVAGRYRVVKPIGRGGMGCVYLAEHTTTGARVALKVLHASLRKRPNILDHFKLEATNAAALQHVHTVRVYDFGVDGDPDNPLPYLVMEYVSGRRLNELIDSEGRLPWRRVVRIASQVLSSLTEAHEHDLAIVHQDVKPSNILVLDQVGERDLVKLLDFGISRTLASPSEAGGGQLGSPNTMAPEQWRGEASTPQTDLYAVGCTSYEALTGRPPFDSDDLDEMADLHTQAPVPPVSKPVAQRTPSALLEWLESLLEKAPEDRPESARAALEQLYRAAAAGSLNTAELAVAPDRDSGRRTAPVRLTVVEARDRHDTLNGDE